MATLRLLSVRTPSAFHRMLSTTPIRQKTPSLADVTPNSASVFDRKQAGFREQVKEAQKLKEQQDSQSVNASTSPEAPYNAVYGAAPTTPPASDASSASSDSLGHVALGSLSTHDVGQARDTDRQQESTKRKGALSNLIYGTSEGQQMDREIEKSFSQVLARGKYMHSIVFHDVKPDKVDEYVELVGGWYPKVASREENHVNLVGSWRTEVGDCDTFGKIYFSIRPMGKLTFVYSPHMGISTLSRLPLLSPLHRLSSRIPRLRPQAQISHYP